MLLLDVCVLCPHWSELGYELFIAKVAPSIFDNPFIVAHSPLSQSAESFIINTMLVNPVDFGRTGHAFTVLPFAVVRHHPPKLHFLLPTEFQQTNRRQTGQKRVVNESHLLF